MIFDEHDIFACKQHCTRSAQWMWKAQWIICSSQRTSKPQWLGYLVRRGKWICNVKANEYAADNGYSTTNNCVAIFDTHESVDMQQPLDMLIWNDQWVNGSQIYDPQNPHALNLYPCLTYAPRTTNRAVVFAVVDSCCSCSLRWRCVAHRRARPSFANDKWTCDYVAFGKCMDEPKNKTRK